MSVNRFVPGSFYRQSDFSGAKVRSTDTEKMWNGYWVAKAREFELRNAQDFVRGVPDEQAAPEPRPRPKVDSFVGPLFTVTTAAAAAGATSLSVESSVRMFAGDSVLVMMQNGVQFRGTLLSVPNSTSLVLTQPLSFGVALDAQVEDETANSVVPAGS